MVKAVSIFMGRMKRILKLKSLWLLIVLSMVYIYQSVELSSVSLWDGYYVFIFWGIIQLIIAEFFYLEFTSVPWTEIDALDILLVGALMLGIAVLSASVAVDFIPENSNSNIHIHHGLLTPHQCDAIVSIAEKHAHNNLLKYLDQNKHAEEEVNTDLSTKNNMYINKDTEPSNAVIASGGWLTDRHAYYPTTDISAYTIQQNITIADADGKHSDGGAIEMDFVTWLNNTVENTIFPILYRQYGLDPSRSPPLLSMKDLFIVKYDADTPHAQRHLQIHTDSSQLSFNIALSVGEKEEEEGAMYVKKEESEGLRETVANAKVSTIKEHSLVSESNIADSSDTATQNKRKLLVPAATEAMTESLLAVAPAHHEATASSRAAAIAVAVAIAGTPAVAARVVDTQVAAPTLCARSRRCACSKERYCRTRLAFTTQAAPLPKVGNYLI